MITALASPHVDILGHCTGRMVLGKGRPESEFDDELVFAAAAHLDKAVEINCRPERLDPPMRLLKLVVDAGLQGLDRLRRPRRRQLEWQPYGCARAAEAGVPIERIVNTWPADELLAWTGLAPDGLTGRQSSRNRIAAPGRISYKRGMTMTATDPRTDTDTDTDEWSGRVATACRLLEANDEGVPALADVAAEVGVSPDALRRAFVRLLGVTPRKYADTLRRERLRDALRDGDDVTRALFTAGYGSTSRLYEGAHEHLGMTPASYKAGGAGTTVVFTVADTSLGSLLVAVTERGLCKIDLSDEARTVEESLHDEFHAADIRRDDDALAPVVDDVVARIDGRVPTRDLPLDVRGTAFQRAGVGGAAADPGRRDPHLRRGRRGHRRAAGEPRRRQRVRGQPGPDRGARATGWCRPPAASATTGSARTARSSSCAARGSLEGVEGAREGGLRSG